MVLVIRTIGDGPEREVSLERRSFRSVPAAAQWLCRRFLPAEREFLLPDGLESPVNEEQARDQAVFKSTRANVRAVAQSGAPARRSELVKAVGQWNRWFGAREMMASHIAVRRGRPGSAR